MTELFTQMNNKPKHKIKRTTLRKVKPKRLGPHKCFPGYKVMNELGAGVFGKTFLVEKGTKQYAIKEIEIKEETWNLSPDIQMKNIEQEIYMGKELGKKNISPKVYDSYVCKENGHKR